jgi:hypothetical protein
MLAGGSSIFTTNKAVSPFYISLDFSVIPVVSFPILPRQSILSLSHPISKVDKVEREGQKGEQ